MMRTRSSAPAVRSPGAAPSLPSVFPLTRTCTSHTPSSRCLSQYPDSSLSPLPPFGRVSPPAALRGFQTAFAPRSLSPPPPHCPSPSRPVALPETLDRSARTPLRSSKPQAAPPPAPSISPATSPRAHRVGLRAHED